MRHTKIRGVDHYYEWVTHDRDQDPDFKPPSSDTDEATKPVMIFLHGWGGSARYWESTALALSDTFDCLLYDMRGFGRSLLPKEQPTTAEALTYELETYAIDLKELLDVLDLQRVYLNAHSTGASIATFFLNLYPERVERAILTCSGIFEYDEKAFSQFHQFGGYVVKFRPRLLAKIPFVNQLFMARFVHRPLPHALSKAFLEDFLLADYEAALGTMLTAVSKKAAEVMPQEFAQISVPTLLVAGEYDIIIPAEMGRRAAALNHNIQYLEIPDTAHFPMLEDADTYLQRVRTFLQQSPALENQAS